MNSNKTEGRTSCGEVRPLLTKYLAGELDGDASARVRAHLDHCTDDCEDALFVLADQRQAAEPALSAADARFSLRASPEAFRGFAAAHRGWIGPVINRLHDFAHQGEGWAQDDLTRAQADLRQISNLWPRRFAGAGLSGADSTLGSEALAPILIADENCQPVGTLSDFQFTREPMLTREGRFLLSVQLPENRYDGWQLFCTLRTTPGNAVTFSSTVKKKTLVGSDETKTNGHLAAVQALGAIGDASAGPALAAALRDQAADLVVNGREAGEVTFDEPALEALGEVVIVPLEEISLYLMPPTAESPPPPDEKTREHDAANQDENRRG